MDKYYQAIIFDLHNVLFSTHYKAAFKKCLQMPHKLKFFRTVVKPSLLYQCFILSRTKIIEQHHIDQLYRLFPDLDQWTTFFYDLVNAQRPIEKTILLIQSLKQDGYTLGIFSNINEHAFAQLAQQFPSIFCHFTLIGTCQKKNQWLRKPHQQAFLNFLQEHALTPNRTIFIDDKDYNIKTAANCGMQAILFKSPQQLYNDLADLLDFSYM